MTMHNIAKRMLYTERKTISFPYDGLLDLAISPELFSYQTDFAYVSPYQNFIPQNKSTECDLIVYNHPTEQFKQAKTLERINHANSILFLHDFPPIHLATKKLLEEQIKRAEFICVFHQEIAKAWKIEDKAILLQFGLPDTRSIEKTNNVCLVGNFSEEDEQVIKKVVAETGCKIPTNHTFLEFSKVLATSKICICPSNNISCESAMLWAMSHGCAVITNKSEWSTIFGEKAYLVNKLADSIDLLKLLGSEDIEAMGQMAKTLIGQQMSQRVSQIKLAEIIKTVSQKAWKL